MKRVVTGIFIVLFAALSILGIVFMVHQGDMKHDGCLAGGAFNTACPQNMSAFSMIGLHFDALGTFSSATFSSLPTIGGPALLGIVLSLFASFGAILLSYIVAIIMRRRKVFDLDHSLFHWQMSMWFALHNKKDLSFEMRF